MNDVTQRIADRLGEIAGPHNVIFGDAEALRPYSRDETPDYRLAHMPEAVVRPAGAEEVVEVVRLAAAEKVPITPRGGGTGLAGGAVPLRGGIVIALDRMARVIDLDRGNTMIVVEPGVVTRRINELAEPEGLLYAGYPMSLDDCHVGGNVATNAGGAKAIKYGTTGRYVAGLDVVTAAGRLLALGGRLVKNATDATLLRLMIGSEGILGVFTRVVLRLLPRPGAETALLAMFAAVAEAASAVPAIATGAGLLPAACEFMDRTALELGCRHVGEPVPPAKVAAALLISLDGPDELQVRRDAARVADICRRAGAADVEIAATPARAERFWEVRRSIGSACKERSAFQGDEDIVVPVAAIPRLVAFYHELSGRTGMTIPAYGHAGDGNIHAHFFPPAGWTPPQWDAAMDKALAELYARAAALGGRISGEHGIGVKRKKYLHLAVSADYLAALAAVKRALDPANILNPGKVVDV